MFFAQGQTKQKLNDSIHNIFIQNAIVTEIGKSGNITYGTITGEIFATVGKPIKVVDEIKKNEPSKPIDKLSSDEPASNITSKQILNNLQEDTQQRLH